MDIVPVIDLKGGQVVRALRGQRQAYRPIVSPLCNSSDPLVVAPLLLARAGASTLYLADLDALAGAVLQLAPIARLLDALPGDELWLDGGFHERGAAERALRALGSDRVTPVYGSESIASLAALAALGDRAILSLDARGDERLDPAGCWNAAALWPKRVIAMTLDRVGSNRGPDLEAFAKLRRLAPHAELIGAGGMRDASDLEAARDAGARAWLVASALHDLRLP